MHPKTLRRSWITLMVSARGPRIPTRAIVQVSWEKPAMRRGEMHSNWGSLIRQSLCRTTGWSLILTITMQYTGADDEELRARSPHDLQGWLTA